MRSSKSRSRNKSNRQRTLGNVINRVFDSSGPEGKVRGTPQQIIDKYLALARDAQLSGDRVAEQSFLQHAEHYTRMLGEAQREQAERQQHQNLQQGGNRGDGDDGAERQQDRRDDRQQGERQQDHRHDGRQNDGRQNEQQRRRDRDDQPRPERPARAADGDAGGDGASLPAFAQPDEAASGFPPARDVTDAAPEPVATPEDDAAAPMAAAPAEASEDAPKPRARRTTRSTTGTPRAPRSRKPAPDTDAPEAANGE